MTVHLVVPAGIDDPRRPSGGNVYDRRLAAELERCGWVVREHRVTDSEGLARVLATLPEGSTVLVDGLVGAGAAGTVAASRWLRVVLLLHMAEANREVLEAVAAVVTTSEWTRGWVVERGVDADRVHVALPGADVGPLVAGTDTGGHLLCVGPVTAAKGHDVLLAALAELDDLDWRCTWVGASDGDPEPSARVTYTGPLLPAELDRLRAGVDLVVSAARAEAFGMAVAEGLARGIPAVVTEVGGHAEAVGDAGILVPGEDPAALAGALRRWLTEPELRTRLRHLAAGRRATLPSWAGTARVVAGVLNQVSPEPVSPTDAQPAHG